MARSAVDNLLIILDEIHVRRVDEAARGIRASIDACPGSGANGAAAEAAVRRFCETKIAETRQEILDAMDRAIYALHGASHEDLAKLERGLRSTLGHYITMMESAIPSHGKDPARPPVEVAQRRERVLTSVWAEIEIRLGSLPVPAVNITNSTVGAVNTGRVNQLAARVQGSVAGAEPGVNTGMGLSSLALTVGRKLTEHWATQDAVESVSSERLRSLFAQYEEEAVREVIIELQAANLVDAGKPVMAIAPLDRVPFVRPRGRLFIAFEAFLPYSPREDVLALADAIVASDHDFVTGAELQAATRFSSLRINMGVALLKERGLINAGPMTGAHPYTFQFLTWSPRIKQWVHASRESYPP